MQVRRKQGGTAYITSLTDTKVCVRDFFMQKEKDRERLAQTTKQDERGKETEV